MDSGKVVSDNSSQPQASPPVISIPEEARVTRASVIGIAYSSAEPRNDSNGGTDSAPETASEGHEERYVPVSPSVARPLLVDPAGHTQPMSEQDFQTLQTQHELQALAVYQQSLPSLTQLQPSAVSPGTQEQLQLQQAAHFDQYPVVLCDQNNPYYYHDSKMGTAFAYPYPAQYSAQYCPPTPPFNSPQGYGTQQQTGYR